MSLDAYPVTVQIPKGDRKTVVSFARLFEHDGRLWVAETLDRGKTITGLSEYDRPDGDPEGTNNKGTWSGWAWRSCGCSSRWGRWTPERILENYGMV